LTHSVSPSFGGLTNLFRLMTNVETSPNDEAPKICGILLKKPFVI
jgi:hypothetical protein